MLKERFERILDELLLASKAFYGARLISLAVFGSVARGTMRPDSDVDLLLVVDPLPDGRMTRIGEFSVGVENRIKDLLEETKRDGIYALLSAILKTKAEVQAGSFLFTRPH